MQFSVAFKKRKQEKEKRTEAVVHLNSGISRRGGFCDKSQMDHMLLAARSSLF